jgi:hypothetical protein
MQLSFIPPFVDPEFKWQNLIICIYVLHISGSRIISDEWRGYRNVRNMAGGVFTHDTINHRQNFVDPIDPTIHTQTIEGML